MRLSRLIFGAVALFVGAAIGAQTVTFHGYMDYTNFALGQAFDKSPAKDEWTHTEPSAEFGSFYNGRLETTMNVVAANFEFNAGIRLDASLGPWYNLYSVYGAENKDKDGYVTTPFHLANMKVQFFNQQLSVYTGKFEEWNNGFIYNGYQLGGQFVRNVADRGMGQHFTGLEFKPNFLSSLRLMVGAPILPVWGNGVNYATPNQWKNLYKKVNVLGSYKLMSQNIVFNFGFRPGTYYSGIYSYDKKDGSTTNYFGEGFVQVDLPSLFYGIKLNATYDLRYRKNDDVDKFTTLHYFGVSGSLSPMNNLTVTFEDRFVYADDHFISNNEKLLYNILGVGATYNIPNTSYVVGFNGNVTYAQDASGSCYTGGDGQLSNGGNWSDGYAMTTDWMTSASGAGAGAAGRYFGAYAYPYFQKNFKNLYFRGGVEVQYTNYHVTKTAQNVTYRIPFAFCAWF